MFNKIKDVQGEFFHFLKKIKLHEMDFSAITQDAKRQSYAIRIL